jgi:hypothetical protein
MQNIWGYTVLLLPVAVAIGLIFIFRWQARVSPSAHRQTEWLATKSPLRLNRICFECIYPVPLEALTGSLPLRNRRVADDS